MSTTLADIVINVMVNDRNVDRQLNRTQRTLNTSAKRMGSAVGGVMSTALGAALGIGIAQTVGKALGALGKLPGLVTQAAAVQSTANAFKALTNSIGETADVMLTKLQRATDGMVANSDLMSSATRFMSMGLARSSDEAARLSEIAVKLGGVMGRGPTAAMEEFALLLANTSIPRLDTFGISAARVRARVEELQNETAGLSREQAFMTAVMEEGTRALATVGDATSRAETAQAKLAATIKNTQGALGQIFLPIWTEIISVVASFAQRVGPLIVNAVENMVTGWLNGIANMERETVRGLGRLAGFMFAFGENITKVLAEGITAAVSFVIKALAFLGNVIGRFLAPGSPPRLLPDLDKWGTEAANEWLQGWTQADFGILGEVGKLVESTLMNIRGDLISGLQSRAGREAEGGARAGILARVSETRKAVAEAIQQFRETGNVGAQAFERIKEAAGAAGEAVVGLVRRQIDLAKATARVASIQKNLSAVESKLADIRDRQRLASIRAQLETGGLSGEETQALLLESQRTQLEKQLRTAEQEEQAKQSELDIFKERLGVQADSLKLTQGVADALSFAAEAGKKLKDNLSAAFADLPSLAAGLDTFAIGPQFTEQFTKIKDLVNTEFIPGVEEGRKAFEGFADGIKKSLEDLGIIKVTEVLDPITGEVISTTTEMGQAAKDLGTAFAGIGAAIAAAKVVAGIAAIVGVIGTLIGIINPLILAVGLLSVAWTKDWLNIRTITTDFWNNHIKPVFGDWDRFMKVILPGAIKLFKEDWAKVSAGIKKAAETAFLPITLMLDGIKLGIEALQAPLEALGGWFDGLKEKAKQLAEDGLDKLKSILPFSPPPLAEGADLVRKAFARLGSQGVNRLTRVIGGSGQRSLAKTWGVFLDSMLDSQDTSEDLNKFIERDFMRSLEELADWVGRDLVRAFEDWEDVLQRLLDFIDRIFIGSLSNLLQLTANTVGGVNEELAKIDTGAVTTLGTELQRLASTRPDLEAIAGFLQTIAGIDVPDLDLTLTFDPLIQAIWGRINTLQTEYLDPRFNQLKDFIANNLLPQSFPDFPPIGVPAPPGGFNLTGGTDGTRLADAGGFGLAGGGGLSFAGAGLNGSPTFNLFPNSQITVRDEMDIEILTRRVVAEIKRVTQ